MNSWIRH